MTDVLSQYTKSTCAGYHKTHKSDSICNQTVGGDKRKYGLNVNRSGRTSWEILLVLCPRNVDYKVAILIMPHVIHLSQPCPTMV